MLQVAAAPPVEPSTLAAPGLTDPVAFSDPLDAEPGAADPVAFTEPVVAEATATDPVVAEPAASPAVEPVPVDLTTGGPPAPMCEAAPSAPPPPEPVAPPTETSSEVPLPGTPEAIPEPAPAALPADGGEAAAESVRAVPEIQPTATLVDLRAVMTSDLPVDAASVDPEAVDLEGTAQEDAGPLFCSQPATGVVDATELRALPLGMAGVEPASLTAAGSAANRVVPAAASPSPSAPAVAVASEDVPPASPAPPPAPVRLPAPLPPPAPVAPVGPAGPAGSSAATASGASCSGAGSNDHSDGIDAVLDAQVAVSLAQAALRLSSGFAGSVVGGADDPGARPD